MSKKDFSDFGIQGHELPKHVTDDEQPKPEVKPEPVTAAAPEQKNLFDEKDKIGLQLVDLGLGNEFDGKRGREKDLIKKNAVDWYLAKESERQAN